MSMPHNIIMANSGGMSGSYQTGEVGGVVIRAGNDREDHTTASDDRAHMKATFARNIHDTSPLTSQLDTQRQEVQSADFTVGNNSHHARVIN